MQEHDEWGLQRRSKVVASERHAAGLISSNRRMSSSHRRTRDPAGGETIISNSIGGVRSGCCSAAGPRNFPVTPHQHGVFSYAVSWCPHRSATSVAVSSDTNFPDLAPLQVRDSASSYSHVDWERKQQQAETAYTTDRYIVVERPPWHADSRASLRTSAPHSRIRILLEKDSFLPSPTMQFCCFVNWLRLLLLFTRVDYCRVPAACLLKIDPVCI